MMTNWDLRLEREFYGKIIKMSSDGSNFPSKTVLTILFWSHFNQIFKYKEMITVSFSFFRKLEKKLVKMKILYVKMLYSLSAKTILSIFRK